MHIHSIAWEVSPAAERDIQIKDALSPDWIPCHQIVNSLNTGTYFVKISFCMKIIEMYMGQWNWFVVHHILHTSHGTEFKIKHKFWIKLFDFIQMKPSLCQCYSCHPVHHSDGHHTWRCQLHKCLLDLVPCSIAGLPSMPFCHWHAEAFSLTWPGLFWGVIFCFYTSCHLDQ